MEELKDLQPKILFLGIRCSKITFQASPSYLNGEAPGGLHFTMNYNAIKSTDSATRFQENFEITLNDDQNETIVNASFIGLFESTIEVNEEFINSPFIKINAPAILFPFIRAYISTVTINAGLQPIILPTINFSANTSAFKKAE